MRTLLRNLIAGTVLIAAGIGVAGAAELFLGTWNLDLAKSQFYPGPAPKSFKRVFTATGDAFDMQITGVSPDGKPFSRHSVFRLDGKDYPIEGAGPSDTMAVRRIDARHYDTMMKTDGKIVVRAATTISVDGSLFTQVLSGFGADGKATTTTMVLDKQ
jgi:hypothetical protein